MPKESTLPIDKDVRVPDAVRRAAARSDEIHRNAYSDPNAPPAPVADPVAQAAPTPAPVNTAPPVTPQVTPAPVEPDPNQPVNWEHKYNSLRGQYNQSMSRITGLEATLATLTTAPAPPPTPAKTPAELRADSLITQELRDTYGSEFFDAVARGAREALQPELEAKENEIKQLRTQLNGVSGHIAQDARQQMLNNLTSVVPNWEELNTDPDFLNWLRLSDPYSGAIRQSLLTQAFERNDSSRVLAFFKGFLAEGAAVAPIAPSPPSAPAVRPSLETFAAPGRGKATSTPATGSGSRANQTITRSEIASFYADVRANKYASNTAEKDRIEREIWAAQAEGRIK